MPDSRPARHRQEQANHGNRLSGDPPGPSSPDRLAGQPGRRQRARPPGASIRHPRTAHREGGAHGRGLEAIPRNPRPEHLAALGPGGLPEPAEATGGRCPAVRRGRTGSCSDSTSPAAGRPVLEGIRLLEPEQLAIQQQRQARQEHWQNLEQEALACSRQHRY